MILEHSDYFKIHDTIMNIGFNTILRMCVALSYTNDNNESVSYHQEYTSYDDNGSLRTSIYRSFNYYLSIENIKANPIKEYIIIGAAELYRLKMVLQMVMDWFTSKDFIGLFALSSNNELYIDKQVDSIMLDKLPKGKFISFEPIVINYDSGSTEGVRMYLNSNDNYVDIPYETKFVGFVDTIMNFNLYLSAQNMINYLGRPAYGTNNHVYDTKFK